jgi:hypothetical protein
MHNSLREQVREQVEGRNRQPSAALVDSQSIRGADTVGQGRPAATTRASGLLLATLVSGGNVQDRDDARPLLWVLRACSRPFASSRSTAATPANLSTGPPPASP